MVKLKLKSKHWLVDENNRIVMGEGRLALLELIQETGSINQAAKKAKISYKAAWSKIHSTEKHFKQKVVHTDRGRGSSLTEAGKRLLRDYKELKRQSLTADDKIFDSLFK